VQQRHAQCFVQRFRGDMWVSSQLFSFITSWCWCGQNKLFRTCVETSKRNVWYFIVLGYRHRGKYQKY